MQVKSVAECYIESILQLHGENSSILSTFIKLPFAIKIFVLFIFEWPLKTGFTVIICNAFAILFVFTMYESTYM